MHIEETNSQQPAEAQIREYIDPDSGDSGPPLRYTNKAPSSPSPSIVNDPND